LFVLALKSFVHTTNTIIINKLWRRRWDNCFSDYL
jgi:hypothetical protein